MTKDQLLEFIELQNESESHTYLGAVHNARQAGFELDELGSGIQVSNNKYYWHTEHGTLIEENKVTQLTEEPNA